MSITAIVLSKTEYTRKWTGLTLHVHQQPITNALDLLQARFDAVRRVNTKRFFFLDDDDDLPEDYLDVLEECAKRDSAIAYTDELIVRPDGTREVAKRAKYSRKAHRTDSQLIHHLALCDTAAAKHSVARLPRGHFCPEFLLYWDLAKHGASYVPRIGYHWNKAPTGMHAWPCTSVSQMRARLYSFGKIKA